MEDCNDCAVTPNTGNAVQARRIIQIKIKILAMVAENAADGAYEAVAQKGATDALNVGGALVTRATSKTKRV